MGIINEAFGILSNPQRRAEYDQMLAQQDGPELHASPVPSDAKTSYAVHRAEQQAMVWYLKAAEQRHPLAQGNLGISYYYGEGVSASYCAC